MLHRDFQWLLQILDGALFGILAMALHECGHLISAQVVGLRVKRVGFSWKGLYTVRQAGPPTSNMLVSLSGPLANLALRVFWPWAPVFGLANLCCGVCNLLPIPGTDGSRVWRYLREVRENKSLAQNREYLPE